MNKSEGAQRQQDIDQVKGWVDRKSPDLSDSDKQKAAEFGASVWSGNMGVGEAAEIGIKHVGGKDES